MSDKQPKGEGPDPVPVLKGSEVLLHKLSLYAQAQRYLRSNLDDPRAEVNTLSYGTETYSVLALVRACRSAAIVADEMVVVGPPPPPSRKASDAGTVATLITETYHDAFHDITNPALYNPPPQRKWSRRITGEEDGEGDGEGGTAPSLRSRLKRESALMDAAMSAPAGIDCVAPSVRPLSLSVARQTRALRRKARSAKKAGTDGVADEEGNGDAAEDVDNDGEEEGEWDESAQGAQLRELEGWLAASDAGEASRVGQGEGNSGRRLEHGYRVDASSPPRTRARHTASLYEHSLVSFLLACPEERAVLASIRAAAAPTATTLTLSANAAATSAVSTTSSEQWGTRMAALVSASLTSTTGSGKSGSSAKGVTAAIEAEQRQQVHAYLKRVAWLERQRASALSRSPAALDISRAAEPKWSSLSEAERVQREMAHTDEQRKRFRRERKAPSAATSHEAGENP